MVTRLSRTTYPKRRLALMAPKALRHAHPATLEQKVAQLAGEAMAPWRSADRSRRCGSI